MASIRTNLSNQQGAAPGSPKPKNRNIFETLIDGFESCLNDIWSLEVNTIVVSEIGGYRFNSVSCYGNIVAIPHDINEFKKKLPWEDFENLHNTSDAEAKATLQDGIKNHLKENSAELPSYLVSVFTRKMLATDAPGNNQETAIDDEVDPLTDLETTMTSFILIRERLRRAYSSLCRKRKDLLIENADLPTLEQAMSDGLLEDSSFLRELRSLRELYYLVGGKEASNSTTIYDLISAQTIIQMDGDVMNRFHKALLQESEKDFLIKTHQTALSTGRENWNSLVKLIIESVHTLTGFLGLKPH